MLGDFFCVSDGADELPTVFSPVVELSPVDYLEPCDTDWTACGGESDFSQFSRRGFLVFLIVKSLRGEVK